MKVIFLDVDGVLNSRKTFNETVDFSGCNPIGDDHLEHLKKVISATDAKIVVTSTWRLSQSLEKLKTVLCTKGLRVYSVTRNFGGVPRRQEIVDWIVRNEEDGLKFAIIDDDPEAEIEGHFFRTKFDDGLTEEIADAVIRHLEN